MMNFWNLLFSISSWLFIKEVDDIIGVIGGASAAGILSFCNKSTASNLFLKMNLSSMFFSEIVLMYYLVEKFDV